MVSRASPTEVLALAMARTKSISASSSALGSSNLMAASSSRSARARHALRFSIAMVLRPCSAISAITPYGRGRGPVLSGPLRFSLVGRVYLLPDAHHFLDLLGQGVLLFLLSPTTIMVLMPMAGFLLHQPALGHPARLPLEVAFFFARLAHGLSLLSASLAALPVPLQKGVPVPPRQAKRGHEDRPNAPSSVPPPPRARARACGRGAPPPTPPRARPRSPTPAKERAPP